MEDTIKIFEKSHVSDVLVCLNEFRKNKQHCDFKIMCDSMEIHVHKCVIASSSEYFRRMLSHDMIESRSGVVEIKDVNPECLEKCVEFMYTGEISLSRGMKVEMIHVARMLQLNRLCEGIADVMTADLNVKLFLSTREIATTFSFRDLARSCDEFAINNLHAIMKMNYFMEFEAQYLETLLALKHSPLLLDVVKCKAIMNWVNNDCDRAKESLASLLELLNINNLPLSYRKFLLDQRVVSQSPECLDYISKSMPEKHQVKGIEYMGDCNPGIIMVNKACRRLLRYDLSNNVWINMHVLGDNMASRHSSMIIVNQHLYLLDWGRSLFYIDLTDSQATWKSLSTPLTGYGGSFAYLDGMLYVSSSVVHNRRLGRYDMKNDIWSQLLEKELGTIGSGIAAARGLIFVIGGEVYLPETPGNDDGFVLTPIVECFNPVSLSWSSHIFKLNFARSDAPVCSHNDAIYVFGGNCSCYNSIEVLYPHSSCWELFNFDSFGRYRSLAHCLDGKIYIVGGDDELEADETDSVAVFDPNSCTISSAPVFFFSVRDFDTVHGSFLSAAVIM